MPLRAVRAEAEEGTCCLNLIVSRPGGCNAVSDLVGRCVETGMAGAGIDGIDVSAGPTATVRLLLVSTSVLGEESKLGGGGGVGAFVVVGAGV
jgi:hypothetical protein